MQKAVKAAKDKLPELVVITDVCLCQYTDHGHCGGIEGNSIDNDATLDLLARTALSHAKAGADMVAPSDMMDGRVAEIREALDENNFNQVALMAYSAGLREVRRGGQLKASLKNPSEALFASPTSYRTPPFHLIGATEKVGGSFYGAPN